MRPRSALGVGGALEILFVLYCIVLYRQGQIKDLEKVQMRATKPVMTVKHLSYKERLVRLKLPIHLNTDV